MGLLELKFGGVLTRDDALFLTNETGQTVQQGRLTRTGTPGYQNVTA